MKSASSLPMSSSSGGSKSKSKSGNANSSSNSAAQKKDKQKRGSVVDKDSFKAAKGKVNFKAEAIADMLTETLQEAKDFDAKAKDVHTTFERRLGAALVKKDVAIKELLSDWDPDKRGTIKKVPFRQNVRTSLGMVADNKEIDAFFDSVDDDQGGSLDFEELRAAMKKLYKAAGAAEAEAATLSAKANECRAFAKKLEEAHETTVAADTEEQKLEKLKAENGSAVGPQLGNLIVKRNLKIGDLTSKWVKKKDVSRADFRKHVLELGVVAEEKDIDALFDSLDDDGGGSLDLEELKRLLTNLVEVAKQTALDEAALEKSLTALRKTCLEQQQTIAGTLAAKQKAQKEAEAIVEKAAREQAIEDAKREEARLEAEARKQSMKEAKAAKFEEQVQARRKGAATS